MTDEKESKINENRKPVIDRQTQISIMDFFLKTSIPRILKEKEKDKDI